MSSSSGVSWGRHRPRRRLPTPPAPEPGRSGAPGDAKPALRSETLPLPPQSPHPPGARTPAGSPRRETGIWGAEIAGLVTGLSAGQVNPRPDHSSALGP